MAEPEKHLTGEVGVSRIETYHAHWAKAQSKTREISILGKDS